MNLEKYSIPVISVDTDKILETWIWLVGKDKKICIITKSGDLALSDLEGKIYFLNTGIGELAFLANSYSDLKIKLSDPEIFDEIFLSTMIDKLEHAGKFLNPGQVYSYLKLPLIGGNYNLENIYCLDIYEHFKLTGEISLKLKDIPDGSSINIKIED